MSDVLPQEEEEEEILEPQLRRPTAPTEPLRCSPQTQYNGNLFEQYAQCFDEAGKLGSGAFADTVRVRQRQTGQEYALKKLKFPTQFDEETGRNVLNLSQEELDQVNLEVQVLQRLSNGAGGQCNPNVVCYYDRFILVEPNEQGEPTERYALLMQLVPGQTVASLYDQGRAAGRTLNPQRMHQLISSGLKGLAYVHSKGIAHSDIKPENLMVTPGGEIVLLDFGLSCYARGASQEPQQYVCTHAHSGTPAYMAPEVLKGFIDGTDLADGMTMAGDVWGFGASMLELATLQLLYDEPGLADLYCQIKNKELSIGNPQGFEKESAVLLSMLNQDWQARPTAEQALSQLDAAAPLPTAPQLTAPMGP